MITGIVKLAKAALADVDKQKVLYLLECVNLTKQEREIVERTELAGERLADMADLYALSIVCLLLSGMHYRKSACILREVYSKST